MKPPRAIGAIRLLEPILGRARRRWRGGPLARLIWRRPGVRPAPPQPPAPRSSVVHNWAFNLILVWPAGTAARAAPLRQVETRLRTLPRAGRDARGGEAGRLVALVERLWLRSGKGGARGAAGPGQVDAPRLAPPTPAAWRRDASGAPPRQADGGQDVPSAMSPREGRPSSGTATVSREIEARSTSLTRAGAMRVGKLRPIGAGAIRHGSELPAAGAHVSRAVPARLPARTPAATLWRTAAARDESPVATRAESPATALPRPSRRRAYLVWRRSEAEGEGPAASPRQARAQRPGAAERVWRRPPAGPAREADREAHDLAASAPGRSDVHARADRPTAPIPASPAAPAPAALQPAEMSRLVDEVVRRLDRIGRDERMRRGI